MSAYDDLPGRLGGRTVLIIGDVMLDHFVIGRVDRISPEAPVPVVQFSREEYRLGGAANVAHNVTALGGRVEMIGLVGDDADAGRLSAELGLLAIGTSGLVRDGSRCTTRKLRVVTTRNQQVARIDYEDDREVADALEAAVIERIEQLAPSADAILISDYLKGVVSRAVAASAIAAARRRGIPVLVDPKVPHIDYYGGATVITPNHHEAEAVTHMRIRTSAEALAAARRFPGPGRVRQRAHHARRARHDTARTRQRRRAAGRSARSVGRHRRGDTVIATMTLALAAGASLVDAARLANRAAGIVVGKFGPSTVSVEELTHS